MQHDPINILVTIDRNYIRYFGIMLYSLLRSNPNENFDVYIMNTALTDEDVSLPRRIIDGRGSIRLVRVAEDGLGSAPTTDRYPREMYYRIFAAEYLPRRIDRVLYLDPDIIVNGSVRELYDTPMGDAFSQPPRTSAAFCISSTSFALTWTKKARTSIPASCL